MIINISNDIRVSKHLGQQQQNSWICYEPLEGNNLRKKPLWKRTTGLMSTSTMYNWLQTNYADPHIAQQCKNVANM